MANTKDTTNGLPENLKRRLAAVEKFLASVGEMPEDAQESSIKSYAKVLAGNEGDRPKKRLETVAAIFGVEEKAIRSTAPTVTLVENLYLAKFKGETERIEELRAKSLDKDALPPTPSDLENEISTALEKKAKAPAALKNLKHTEIASMFSLTTALYFIFAKFYKVPDLCNDFVLFLISQATDATSLFLGDQDISDRSNLGDKTTVARKRKLLQKYMLGQLTDKDGNKIEGKPIVQIIQRTAPAPVDKDGNPVINAKTGLPKQGKQLATEYRVDIREILAGLAERVLNSEDADAQRVVQLAAVSGGKEKILNKVIKDKAESFANIVDEISEQLPAEANVVLTEYAEKASMKQNEIRENKADKVTQLQEQSGNAQKDLAAAAKKAEKPDDVPATTRRQWAEARTAEDLLSKPQTLQLENDTITCFLNDAHILAVVARHQQGADGGEIVDAMYRRCLTGLDAAFSPKAAATTETPATTPKTNGKGKAKGKS